jgi:diaminopimelate decarboxylase
MSNGDLSSRLSQTLFDRTELGTTFGGAPVSTLAQECGTPLYLYDASRLALQYQRLRNVLPAGIAVFYSIKANPHPEVVAELVRQGAGCEIASGGEYVLARRAGAQAEDIVFAGPGKGPDELEYVVAHGIGEIHLESFEEIEALRDICSRRNRAVKVSIRVNPSAADSGGLLMGGQPTAFGFEEESLGDVIRAVKQNAALQLHGVHVYTGTQILNADSLINHWMHAVSIAARVCELADTSLATIDLGGGLGIPYFSHENELDLEALGKGAAGVIAKAHTTAGLEGARFIVEPGRYLAGPAGIYVAQVRSVKACRGTTFVVLDGGMNHHLAASGNLGQVVRRDYPIVNLSRLSAESEETFVVVGPLCTPIDTLGRKVKMPQPAAGDLIAVLQSGAYGLTASPSEFLSHPRPAEVLVKSGSYRVISPRRSFYETQRSEFAVSNA